MINFRGKNGDWGIPIVTAIVLLLVWIVVLGKEKDDITQTSRVYLQSYGYTNIEISDIPIGCKIDDVTSFRDRGRKFNALMPSGKLISGVVCTAKNNVSFLTVNYQEE